MSLAMIAINYKIYQSILGQSIVEFVLVMGFILPIFVWMFNFQKMFHGAEFGNLRSNIQLLQKIAEYDYPEDYPTENGLAISNDEGALSEEMTLVINNVESDEEDNVTLTHSYVYGHYISSLPSVSGSTLSSSDLKTAIENNLREYESAQN